MKKYDYLIVGAGLFGSVFANVMKKAGKQCLVIEKRGHAAGNIYSEDIEGIQVHKYGPHIFHTSDKEVWLFMNQFAEFNHFRYEPIANYKGELYNLPFNMNTFHQMWGINSPEEAEKILEKQKREINGKPKNLEEQAISLVGRDIYEKLIKGYTQKQWGRSCRELPEFIIKRLPVRMRYDNNYFNDPYQGIPIGGYTCLIEKMLEGIDLELNTDYLKEREAYDKMADRIVYSGPIDAYFDYSFGELEYRSLRFETEILNIPNYQGIAGMNYTDEETPYTRIIEHKHFNFSEDNKIKTVITREFPQEWEKDMEPYYPINDEKNNYLFSRYKELQRKERKTIFGGRLAEYRYYDMGQVIRRALDECKTEREERKESSK